jgi:glycine betaine/choline ABC-type transport system substrate-binding protein
VKHPIFLLALSLLACSCGRNAAIVIGSKNFTEQILLGEIAAQTLERKHLPVERRLGLGGTLLTHEAIVAGGIDIYPEYTGTAASAILKQQPSSDPAQVYLAVKKTYLERFNLVWLPPLGFNDTFAMVVRTADAQKLSEASLSAARSQTWRLGMGFEFLTRPDGLRRLDQVYALNWSGLPKNMDLGLLYLALQNKQIDMAAAAWTDAQLTQPQFSVLKDDKSAFPPYNACYVVRQSVLQQKPEIRQALNALAGRIGDDTMRALNRRVDVDHQQVATVARDFLATQP